MEAKLSIKDKERIVEGIRKKYAEASVTPQGLFNYPTGREGLEGLEYDPKIVESIPKVVIDSFCGVGNPFSLGPIHEGETVLDIGCGGGFDVIFAAIMVGSKGKVTGIDVTPEMLERSKKNLQETPIENVTLKQTTAEELPFPDNNFDVIISNGVFNLIPEKAKAFSEVFRVLKLDGRLMVADQILIGELSKEQRLSAESWAQWEGGALPGKDFLEILQEAGFVNVELVRETGFNTSPKTKGVLVRARKTERLDAWKEEKKQVETKTEIKQKSEDIKSGSGWKK